MAIPTQTDFEVQGSIGEEITMTIDESGMEFLMAILTNLYEDPIGAVIREYSTNAIDAHIEAGITRPVKVTLPTQFRREFRVQDFGVGMDADDIRDTYSKYVASTKRTTNTQAGMFGIGSKSALAYTDKFTVESVKNRRKITAVIERVGRGAARINMLESKTDAPNGTTIVVPVRGDIREWEKKANDFYRYVRPGKFLVDGSDKGGSFSGTKVDDSNWLLPYDYYNNKSVIVMGNVPYHVNVSDEHSQRRFIHYANIGDFTPTPPREGLERDEQFTKSVARIVETIGEDLAKTTNAKLAAMNGTAAADHLREHMNNLKTWNSDGLIRYRGMGLNDDLDGDYVVVTSTTKFEEKSVTLWQAMQAIHVWGTGKKNPKEITENITKKSVACRQRWNDLVLLWLDEEPTITATHHKFHWDVAKNKSSQSSSYGHTVNNTAVKAGDDWKVPTDPPKWSTWDSGNFTYNKHNLKVVPYDEWKNDGTKTLVYFSPTDLVDSVTTHLVAKMFADDDVFLVVKTKNQWEKTKRENPEAKHIKEHAATFANKLVDDAGEAAFFTLCPRHAFYMKFDGELFDEYKKFAKNGVGGNAPNDNIVKIVQKYAPKRLTAQVKYDTIVEQIGERYPLLSSYSDNKHNQTYITAMDAYMEETE